MSHFINGLFDPTLQNFLIARMCRSFTEAYTMAMMFEDSMTGLQVLTHAPTNNHENTEANKLIRQGKTFDVQFAKGTMRDMNAPSYDNDAHNIVNGVELS